MGEQFGADLKIRTPSSLTLASPSSSPGGLSTPIIRVSGIVPGNTITLFSDGTCTTPLGSVLASGTSVDITSGALGLGPTTFYAQAVAPDGTVSECSSASYVYTYQLPIFSLSRNIYSITDTGTAIGESIVVKRNIPGGSYAVNLNSQDVSAVAADVNIGSSVVNFSGNTLEQSALGSIVIPVTNVSVEGDKRFKLKLSSPTGGATLGAVQESGVNLIDTQLTQNFFFSDSFYSGEEDDSSIAVLVKRAGSTAGTASVTVDFISGSAIPGTDFVSTPIPVTFSSGQSEKWISIPVLNRAWYQSNRTFYVELKSPSNGFTLRATSTAKVRILDVNDPLTCDSSNDNLGMNLGFGGLDSGIYLICSLTQLHRVRNNLTLNFRLMADLDLDPTLDADPVTVGLQPFTPITGTFSGIFDGNEHVLKNFRFNQTAATADPVALFNLVGGNATTKIRGLNLIDASITSTTANVPLGGIIGKIVTQIDTLEDLSLSGLVKSSASGTGSAGGILNRSEATIASPLLRNFSAGYVSGGGRAGGILVGIFGNGYEADLSYNYSISTVTGVSATGGLCAGTSGSVQNTSLMISNSHNKGVIIGGTSSPAGGIFGSISGTNNSNLSVTSSFNSGPVYQGFNSGGLVGEMYCVSPAPVTCDISFSYSSGEVISSVTNSYVGGLVGILQFPASITLTNVYSSGDVTATGPVRSLGGLVGYATANGYPSVSTLTIINSHVSGQVSSPTVANVNVGGLIGDLRPDASGGGSALITNSYATGVVSTQQGAAGGLVGLVTPGANNLIQFFNSYSTGNTSNGSDIAGGIVGYANLATSGNKLEFISSYSTGTVTTSGQYGGGILGLINITGSSSELTFTDSYHITGTVSSNNHSGGLIGRVAVSNGSNSTISIDHSYSASALTSSGNASGLVDELSCTSAGTGNVFNISRSYADATISTFSGGGLVGYAPMGGGCNMSITNSYAAGSINGSSSAGLVNFGSAFGGGSITLTNTFSQMIHLGTTPFGLMNGSGFVINSSYWLKDTAINVGVSNDGNQRNAAQLSVPGTFIGWAFDPAPGAPWTFTPGPYPSLL